MNYRSNKRQSVVHGSQLTFVSGKSPILLVCPHGHPDDDTNTDLIAQKMADTLDAFAVINTGYRRSDTVDIPSLKANLNNSDHVDNEVPIFGNKILEFRKEILSVYDSCHVFFIHGMADKEENVDVVLGFGKAKVPSLTCTDNYKNEFAYRLQQANFVVKQGGVGSKYSAAMPTNMNQYFKKHGCSVNTSSMQIELINSLRVPNFNRTAKKLSDVLHNFFYKTTKLPDNFKVSNI